MSDLTKTCAAHAAIVRAYSLGIDEEVCPLPAAVPALLAQHLPEPDWQLASDVFGAKCPPFMVDPFDLPDCVSESVLRAEVPAPTFVMPETGHTYEHLASNRCSWVPWKRKGQWDKCDTELPWFELWRNKSNPAEAFVLYPEYYAGKWVVAQFWLVRAH